MEVEERPHKLRKLSHEPEDSEAQSVEAQHSTITQAPQGNHDPSLETTSKPAQDTADPTELFNRLYTAVSNGEPLTDIPPGLSKNQVKKLRKQAEWESRRGDRKVKRREKTKERKARKRDAKQHEEAVKPTNKEEQVQKQPIPRRPVRLPVTFIIDCGFDDLMVDKERISLGSQLTRVYSDNTRAQFQANLVVSSWGGLLKRRFDSVLDQHYKNWRGIKFVEEDFAQAAEMAKEYMTTKDVEDGKRRFKMVGAFAQYADLSVTNGAGEKHSAPQDREDNPEKANDEPSEAGNDTRNDMDSGFLNINGTIATPTITPSEPPDPSPNSTAVPPNSSTAPPPSEIIYLTSDSPNTLHTLKPNSTYIIGGLVDKNRHKGICYKTALSKGIKTAKLPIGEYMEMQSRFVLATNHVVEIMLKWLECGDWGQAFMEAVPKRKGGRLRNSEQGIKTSGSEGPGQKLDGEDADGVDVPDGEDIHYASGSNDEEGEEEES